MGYLNRIAAIVVTYNRKELLKDTIIALLNQTYQLQAIYIIDNACTDGTKEYIKPYIDDHNNVHYIQLGENSGGAGGFCNGLKIAYDDGYDAVWGMDDDAVPDKTALSVMINHKSDFSDPCVFWSNIIMFDENSKPVCHWRKFESMVQEEHGFTFVGFLIPRIIIQNIGFPRADLFIFYDDAEYSNRVVNAGYKIYRFQDSKIYHPYINSIRNKLFLGKRICVLEMANWKWYYFMRNGLLIYSWNNSKKYTMLYLDLWIIVKSLLVDRKNLNMILLGFFHGLIGKTGKLQQ